MSCHRILILEIKIHLPEVTSLKDKRNLKRSLFDRLRHRYNISIAEVGQFDTKKTLHFTIAYVAKNESTALNILNTLADEIEAIGDYHQGYVAIEHEIY